MIGDKLLFFSFLLASKLIVQSSDAASFTCTDGTPCTSPITCDTSDEDCHIQCIGDNSCQLFTINADYSDNSTLIIDCLGYQSCKDMDVNSDRETIVNCGEPDSSTIQYECDGVDITLNNLPPNSTSQLFCHSEEACGGNRFRCYSGDPSASCEMHVIEGLATNDVGATTRLYCEGQVAFLGAPSHGHCTLNCSYRANDSTDGACDIFASNMWIQRTRLYCNFARTNCISLGGERATNYGEVLTTRPTTSPTNQPSQLPTLPTNSPSASPSQPPTMAPSASPTLPTSSPSGSPSQPPTMIPTDAPNIPPTGAPTSAPTLNPIGEFDTTLGGAIDFNATLMNSIEPTKIPTLEPTSKPNDSSSVVILNMRVKIYILVLGGAGLCLLCSCLALITLCLIRREYQKNQLGFSQKDVRRMTADVNENGPNNNNNQLTIKTTTLKNAGHSQEIASSTGTAIGITAAAAGGGADNTRQRIQTGSFSNQQQGQHKQQDTEPAGEIPHNQASQHLKLQNPNQHPQRTDTNTFVTNPSNVKESNEDDSEEEEEDTPSNEEEDSMDSEDETEDDEEASSSKNDDQRDEQRQQQSGADHIRNRKLKKLHSSGQNASKRFEQAIIKQQQDELARQQQMIFEQQQHIVAAGGQAAMAYQAVNTQTPHSTHSGNSQPSQGQSMMMPAPLNTSMGGSIQGMPLPVPQQIEMQMQYYGNNGAAGGSRPVTPNSLRNGPMMGGMHAQPMQPMQPQPIALHTQQQQQHSPYHTPQQSPHQSPRFANNPSEKSSNSKKRHGRGHQIPSGSYQASIHTQNSPQGVPTAAAAAQQQMGNMGHLHPTSVTSVPSITQQGRNYYDMLATTTPTMSSPIVQSPYDNGTNGATMEYAPNVVPVGNGIGGGQYVQMVTHSPNTVASHGSRPTTPQQQVYYGQGGGMMGNMGNMGQMAPHIDDGRNNKGGYHIVDDSKMDALPDTPDGGGIDDAGHIKSQQSLNTPDLPDFQQLGGGGASHKNQNSQNMPGINENGNENESEDNETETENDSEDESED